MTDFTYRVLLPSDAAKFQVLERELFPADPWTKTQIEEELASPWSHYVGVFSGEQLVGVAGIKGNLEADLMSIGVLPQVRRRGIGGELLKRLLEAGAAAGAEKVFLEVRESNEGAIAFYHRFGFQTVGKVRGYYRFPNEDALTLVKTISTL